MKKPNVTACVIMSVILLLCSVLTGCGTGETGGQADTSLVISEVMSSNASAVADRDGDYPDYIVLYNAAGERKNLTGWSLTDNVTKPRKWYLPSVYLEAGEYLVIFASGKDRRDPENGEYHTNFSLKADGETLYLIDSMGKAAQTLDIPALPADVAYGLVQQGEDAGKYCYFAQGMPGKLNTSAHSSELKSISGGKSRLALSEYMNNNYCAVKDNYGEFSSFAELVNKSEEPCSLSGLYLSDKADQPQKWAIPGNITLQPGERVVIWCSGRDEYKDGVLHASFELSSKDTVLTVADSKSVLMSTELESLPRNISKGTNGTQTNPEWLYYNKPTPGKENAGGFSTLEQACRLSARGVWINEVSSVPTAENSYDWIELYNGSGADISLNGWHISNDASLAGYALDGITVKAGEYLLLFAAGETPKKPVSGRVYLPFKIQNSGTDLFLSDDQGNVADYFSTGRLCMGYTAGRLGDDTARLFFQTPTPGAQNGKGYPGYAAAPSLTPGGYVSIGDRITASGLEGQTLRYTTNGSEPTSSSPVFSDFSIKNTTVIKLKAFSDGLLPSETVTATYVVGSHDIDFVSLTADPDDLFSDARGILANGPGYGGNFPYPGANFWKDWERKCTFEYYTASGAQALCFDAGVKVFGQYSRAYDQKSLAIHLRDKYGKNEITYPFFKDNDVTTLSHLVLRAGGQDQKQTRIRDAFCAQVMKGHTTLAIMDWTPVALYINGQYWGFYDLREKINEDYFASHEGLDIDGMTIIKGDSRVITGTNTEIKALYAYVKSHDLSQSANYEYVCSVMDVDNFIDYLITEIFFGNGDTGNKKCYKAKNGKWRWVMFDFDMAMRSETTWGDRFNTIEMLFNPGGHGSNNGFTTCLQTNLIKNSEFRNKFLTRYAELLNTVFMPENMKAVLKTMTDRIDSEMKLHGQRWNRPDYSTWQAQVVSLNGIIDKRRNIAKNQLIKFLSVSQQECDRLFPNG